MNESLQRAIELIESVANSFGEQLLSSVQAAS
jgi:hypothetical protein